MWVPLPGIKFRIVSCNINEMFCDEDSLLGTGINFGPRFLNKKGLSYRDSNEENYDYHDGSWWTLKEPDVKRGEGFFLIVHINTGRRLWANADRDEYGLSKAKSKQYDDQHWQIVPANMEEVHLINFHGKHKLFLREHQKPHIGLFGGQEYRDQFFRLYLEEHVVHAMVYHLDRAVSLGRQPKLVAQQTFSNDSTVEQSQTFTARYTQTKKNSWEHTEGFKFRANVVMAIAGGAPYIAGAGAVHLGIEKEHKVKETEETVESKEMEHEFPLVVPPGKTLRATALLEEEKAEVPYEMIVQFKHTNILVHSYGNWRGLQCVHIHNEIVELDDDDHDCDKHY